MKMKYIDTLVDARSYNEKKDIKTKSCSCVSCGKTIKIDGSNCIGFGIYSCSKCR